MLKLRESATRAHVSSILVLSVLKPSGVELDSMHCKCTLKCALSSKPMEFLAFFLKT